MNLYTIWIFLIVVGIMLGLGLLIYDRFKGINIAKKQYEIFASWYFSFVMFVLTIFTFIKGESFFISLLFLLLFLLGIYMIIRAKKL